MKSLFLGLSKTRRQIAAAGNNWNDRLIAADVGARVAAQLAQEAGGADASVAAMTSAVVRRLRRVEALMSTEGRAPFVVLALGVNGCGKTTTIAKLARYFVLRERRVLLAAGDTFRAAAREQLQLWAKTLGNLQLVGGEGDPAAVAYNAVSAGVARAADVVIVDTAGRLPTQKGLMAELAKIRRAVGKALPGAPHELLLVLDASTGQNALLQARAFADAAGVTGVVLAKLDGSAKGGFLLALAEELPVPVRFVGVGEGADDLAIFNAEEYAAALLAPAQAQ